MKMATDLCSCKRLGFSGTLKGEFPPNAGSSKSSWEAHQTLQGAGFLMSLLGLGIKPATFHAKNSEPVRLQAKWQCYDAYARASTSGCEGRACKESIFGQLCISLLYIVVPDCTRCACPSGSITFAWRCHTTWLAGAQAVLWFHIRPHQWRVDLQAKVLKRVKISLLSLLMTFSSPSEDWQSWSIARLGQSCFEAVTDSCECAC